MASYSPEIQIIILIGAVTGPLSWKWEMFCSPEQLQEAHQKGYITSVANDGFRTTIQVDANLLKQIDEIDQQKLFNSIHCPILLIHGDAGQEELQVYNVSKQSESSLPKGSMIKIIHGANHSFRDHGDEVASLIKEWLNLASIK